MTVAPFYQTVTSSNDYYMYDGFGVNTPNDIQGRLLLIGVYDLTQIKHFANVKNVSVENLNLVFSDNQNAHSAENGVFPLEVELNDRVLLKDQTNKNENGIYIITKLGSENEAYEIQRASDACSYNGLISGSIVFCESNNHLYQLMPYTVMPKFGEALIAFIDLTVEGFYSNTCYGLRLVDSVCCSNIVNKGNGKYEFNVPNFLNISSPRLLKVLCPYNVDIADIMENLLTKNFAKNLQIQASSGNTSSCCCVVG